MESLTKEEMDGVRFIKKFADLCLKEKIESFSAFYQILKMQLRKLKNIIHKKQMLAFDVAVKNENKTKGKEVK